VAFESDESGEQEIYVRPFPGPGGQRKISTNGGVEPMWNPRGGELFYLEENKMMVVSYSAVGDLFQAETPRLLFETEFVSRYPFTSYDVFPDGEHFVMLQAPEARTEENSIFFVLNWAEELKRLVPVEN
jgi:serine/threonine-protein kinase